MNEYIHISQLFSYDMQTNHSYVLVLVHLETKLNAYWLLIYFDEVCQIIGICSRVEVQLGMPHYVFGILFARNNRDNKLFELGANISIVRFLVFESITLYTKE